MSHIFIAHVEEDADIALGIALGLEEAGYRSWCYEVDSVVGKSYILQTGEAVAQSDAVVVIISPDSLSSNQVTKEIVRAHESGRPFLPVLHGVSHVEFQQRQLEWREAIGASTSIRVSKEGMTALVPKIIEGVKSLGIKASAKVDTARINMIRTELDEKHPLGDSGKSKDAFTPESGEGTQRTKSKRVLIIASAAVIVIVAVLVTVFSLRPGEEGEGTSTQEEGPPIVTMNPPFYFSNLVIEPAIVACGEEVKISFTITSISENQEQYSSLLNINGLAEEVKMITLNPGDTGTLSYIVVRDTAGTYDVEMSGLTGYFVVEER
jgi:hypothetical protein